MLKPKLTVSDLQSGNKLLSREQKEHNIMKEKDILHECSNLWVRKVKGAGYVIHACGVTHSIGFLSCATLEQAIDSCEALARRPDLVKNLTTGNK